LLLPGCNRAIALCHIHRHTPHPNPSPARGEGLWLPSPLAGEGLGERGAGHMPLEEGKAPTSPAPPWVVVGDARLAALAVVVTLYYIFNINNHGYSR